MGKAKCLGIIVNPNAGRGISSTRYRDILELLEKEKVTFMHAYLAETSDTKEILDSFFREKFDAVIILGGDGTLNHVAPYTLGTGIPLFVIPFGSGNDFHATHWNTGADRVRSIVRRILRGDFRKKRVDAGVVEGPGLVRHFFNSFGFGLAGMVARNENRRQKKRGFQTFFLTALKDVLFNAKPLEVRLDLGGETYEGPILTLHTGINHREGGGFRTFPLAKPDDGLLDVVFLKGKGFNRLSLLMKLRKVKEGKHIKDRDVVYRQVPSFSFRNGQSAVAHVDGEDFELPSGHYSVRVLRKQITIVEL